jgi:hypothetical protein
LASQDTEKVRIHLVQAIYKGTRTWFQLYTAERHLLRSNSLELLRAVNEVVRIRLRNELPLVGLLDEVLVTLLVGESNCILLRLELDSVALHVIGR